MPCPSCGQGFHEECVTGCTNCHSDDDRLILKFTTGSSGAPIKNPENVKDVLSTGRKRAAIQYPIFEGEACEWQGKKNCGGGTPIIGCINGIQVDRHHGPIKNPLHNEPGNVHRICKHCHNRWHAINDPIYDEKEYSLTRHNPEEATELELLANVAYWKLKR